jgi:hypothetical protein
MDQSFRWMTDFLHGVGVEKVAHSNKTFMAHLVAVYRLMESEGCGEEACRAGMFHSIYGTELFQGFSLPLERRGEVRALIGERAERLAYANCAMDRASFDHAVPGNADSYRIRDRLTGEDIVLSRADFDDLCRVHLYDWLEQAPRSRHGWGYRRSAYRQMAERLGEKPLQAYERTFAEEPVTQKTTES